MNYLITGSSSSLGYHLTEYFSRNKSNNIYAMYSKNKPKLNKKNVKFLKFDLNKNQKEFKRKIDIFIHCASAVPSDNLKKKNYIDINYKFSKKLTEDLIKRNLKKIIFFSSMSVYKKNKNKIDEKSEIFNNDYYAESKIMYENYLYKSSLSKKNLNILILRLPGYVGAKSKNNFISNLKEKIKNNSKVLISNPNTLFNNIVHEKTLAKIIKKFIKKEKRNYLIINPASKNPIKIINMVKFIYKLLNKKYNYDIINNNSKSFVICTNLIRKLNYEINTTKQEILRFIN